MSTDSFLLQDEELLELIEEFNGCDQRMFSENVLDMLDCELNVLENIEEVYEFFLVSYTKVLCTRSHEFGFSEQDCKEFMKSNLVREQQKYMQKMRAEEKRLKGKRRKLFSVYVDEEPTPTNTTSSAALSRGHNIAHHHSLSTATAFSPIKTPRHNSTNHSTEQQCHTKLGGGHVSIHKKIEPTLDASEYVMSSSPMRDTSMANCAIGERKRARTITCAQDAAISEKENVPHNATKHFPSSLRSSSSGATSIQGTPPLQVRHPMSLSLESSHGSTPPSQIYKPKTPIQKVLTPSNCDTRSSHIQHLNLQFRRFLVKQTYQIILKLGELKPTDNQFKQYKQHLEKIECDLKYSKDKHTILCNQLHSSSTAVTAGNGHPPTGSGGDERPLHIANRYWRDEGLIF
eukprot:CAMPEP_0117434954 /NCGR_PEP_ID=MMETSP0759-20121206/223_1 /TAXON_ID=63605 /ORGANISM="Percolomonas cosmopolitus, Strain WS" /LENGTH=401 /DNA_ID=CAMNT_0005226469 /DNA_START=585 /DNA_END=1790 /DNA_ORIENTATION=+